MRPRVTDWGLALLVAAAFGSGLWTLTIGVPALDWVFVVHGGFGFALGALTLLKLHRVRWRLVPRVGKRWPATYRDRRTLAGVASTLLLLLVLVTGIWWVHGGTLVVWGYNLLNWHIVSAFLLVAVLSTHMIARALPLKRADVSDRRQALRFGGLVLGGLLLAPLQHVTQGLLRLPGAERRFTGSREVGSYAGNAFPTTSWVADSPRLLALDTWQLRIDGAVQHPLMLRYADVIGNDELEATLDCTGGFYSTQIWRGISVGRVLEQAGPNSDAAYVRFVSVTGYRWSLPLAQARQALLATHVGGEPLSHSHGAPARLVAPGERGFVWVKWLVAVEVLTAPDPGQLLAINTSSLSAAGRGLE
jgi:DMSO/TMAO reductase YedYZ molybdopterin-dependent catalytic subunit